MLVKSCISCNLDPYKAGVEIAEQLAEIQPEVIFLFSSIHYQGSPELLESLYAELSPCVPILIGNTGDGIYAKEAVADIGVSALAINTGGKAHWHVVLRHGLQEHPFECAEDCLRTVLAECAEKPKFLFLASDFRTDSSEVLRALNQGTDVPVVGGLAADDYTFVNCHIFANQEVSTDALALLAAEGEIDFDIRLGNSPQPVGKPGRITENASTFLRRVDDLPIMEFLEREMGKPLDHIDKGILTMRTVNPDHAGEHQVRSLLLPEDLEQERGVKLFGGVANGEQIQVCIYPQESMIQDIANIASSVSRSPFRPQAALIVSCAGRKAVLGGTIQIETSGLLKQNPTLQALAGYPSFGEFAPAPRPHGYSPTRFHNMTYALLLLAAP